MRSSLALLLFFAATRSVAAAQAVPPVAPDTIATAFADPGTAALMRRARDTRFASDGTLRSYTAVVSTRMDVALRTPLKDRTLYQKETAARVRWSRDAPTIVQMLAGREKDPGGVEPPSNLGIDVFDPASDRLYFGLDSNDDPQRPDSARTSSNGFEVEHPLGAVAERYYRYESGDTITIGLSDGTTVRVAELRVIPRRDDPHTVRGLISIDLATGALVRGAFRLARRMDVGVEMGSGSMDISENATNKLPGFLKPLEIDVSLVTVEYSLWELKHWLPVTSRFEGLFRAGVVAAPVVIEVSYEIESAESDADSAVSEQAAVERVAQEWLAAGYRQAGRPGRDSTATGTRRTIVLLPLDSTALLTSPLLPKPVSEDAPGFVREEDLEQLAEALRDIAAPYAAVVRPHLGWGFGEPGMLRYNRIEALSIGVRGTRPLPFAEASASARIGLGDLHPNADLTLRRRTLKRTVELRGYRELAFTDETGHPFGLGASLSALVLGRDEGEYYRTSGASLTWSPPSDVRPTWSVTTYFERQDDVRSHTDVALPGLWKERVFRPNIVADEATQVGATLRLRPWWGSDADGFQLGADALLQGETGDYRHARARLILRAAAPLVTGMRLGLEVGAGTSTGDVPAQRRFYLGGGSTLRGYDPSTVSGTSMARLRVELARALGAINLAAFTDWGWAGERTQVRRVDQRLSVGAGISILDGLLRLDLARGLWAPRGWRLELRLDSAF